MFRLFGCSAADSKQDHCDDTNKMLLHVAVATFTLSLRTKRDTKVSAVVHATKLIKIAIDIMYHHHYYPMRHMIIIE